MQKLPFCLNKSFQLSQLYKTSSTTPRSTETRTLHLKEPKCIFESHRLYRTSAFFKPLPQFCRTDLSLLVMLYITWE